MVGNIIFEIRETKMPRWKTLSSKSLFETGFFKLRVDECELPDGRVMPRYYVMEFSDWVNVVPITDSGEMVLLEQYRHGAGQVFLEIPGGTTNPGQGEDPRLAGERELLEETGYQAREWIHCGHHYPNPALQNNRMHTYLALGCRLVGEQNLDPFEDIKVVTMPVADALKAWQDGAFSHSLISASLGLALKSLVAKGFKVF